MVEVLITCPCYLRLRDRVVRRVLERVHGRAPQWLAVAPPSIHRTVLHQGLEHLLHRLCL